MNARGPITAAIALAFAFLNMAFILIIMDFEFVALTIILVYIGAIIILFLFIIMLLHIKETELREQHKNGLYFITLTFFYINFITVVFMVLEFENLLFLNDLALFNTSYGYLIIDSKSCINNTTFINGPSNWNNFIFSGKDIPRVTDWATELTLPKNFSYLLSDSEIVLAVSEEATRGPDFNTNILKVHIDHLKIPSFPFYKVLTEQDVLGYDSTKHKFPLISSFRNPKLETYSTYHEYCDFSFYKLRYPTPGEIKEASTIDKCFITHFNDSSLQDYALFSIINENSEQWFKYNLLDSSYKRYISLLTEYTISTPKSLYRCENNVVDLGSQGIEQHKLVPDRSWLIQVINSSHTNPDYLYTYKTEQVTRLIDALPVVESNNKETGQVMSKNYYLFCSITNDDLYTKIGKFINFKHLLSYSDKSIDSLLLTHIKDIITTSSKDFKPTLRSYNTNLELRTELHSLGLVMYTYGCIYLILVSVLLLIALLGAVILITLDTTEFVRLQQSSNQNAKGTNINIS